MPALGSVHVAYASAGLWDPASIVLTLASIICMVTVVSMCTCCARKVKNRDPDDVYGVVNPAAVTMASGEGPCSSVQFRNLSKGSKVLERHSQPSSKTGGNSHNSTRASAPGRALPQVPGDIYTAIDKRRPKDDIRFADEGCNPTYESIDPDADSIVDPLYSKVGETRTAKRDRKYDYPVFSGRRPAGQGPSTKPDEVLYQSASQIYAGGSEDPYSSITSDSRAAGNGNSAGDGDSSSAYDPGYAKVRPDVIEAKRMERLEKTERELDQLYSKIRRSSRDYDAEPRTSTSVIPPMVDLPSRNPHILAGFGDHQGTSGGPGIDMTDNVPAQQEHPISTDAQSVSSREPSYRYITVRENAEVVRERLRQQGQLGPPVREHYYSTIGNEYEVVGDGSSTTYSHVRPPATQQSAAVPSSPSNPFVGLSVSTSSVHPSQEYVPPPPTSPIPDRISTSAATTTTTTTTIRHSGHLPETHRSPNRMTSSMGDPSTVSRDSATTPSSILPSAPYRNPFGHHPTSGPAPIVERIEPIANVTYAVVSKSRGQSAETAAPHHPLRQSITTTFEASPSHRTTQQLSNSDSSAAPATNPVTAWNTPSLGTATSFAGLHRTNTNSNTTATTSSSSLPAERTRASSSPMDTVHGIQEFMQRPVLPYVAPTGTVIGRKVTEERETVVEQKSSNVSGSGELPSEFMSRSSTTNFNPSFEPSRDNGLRTREASTERVHHVEIRRLGTDSHGPSADEIISGRRYRGNSQSNSLASAQSREELRPLSLGNQVGQPGPSSPVAPGGGSLQTSPDDKKEPLSSRLSARSGLPIPQNGEELRQMRDRSRQRRQASVEREERERSIGNRESQHPPMPQGGSAATDRSRERRKPWKEETEEEKIERLGTIYTANDYVSTIDMGRRGRGGERPWPMTGSSSPPSLRKEMGRDESEDNNNDKSARENSSPQRPSLVTAGGSLLLPVSIPTAAPLFCWELSDNSSEDGAADGGGCDDTVCFCHSKSPRTTVEKSNLIEMERINWGQLPID